MATETINTRLTGEFDQFARDILELLPDQGSWGEQEYFWLSGRTNRLVEFSHGIIDVLPMPSLRHQLITAFLYRLLFQFVTAGNLGVLVFAPLRVYIGPNKYREPDLVFMLTENRDRVTDQGFVGADLVIEVVSPDDPERDLVVKRGEYASAGIPEYWIVDPQTQAITVLRLDGTDYSEHGVFERGTMATSTLLAGFSIAVDEVFAIV